MSQGVKSAPLQGSFYYASQILMLATPFIVLPYLGRVLGPAGLGLYGIGQAFALIVTTIVEFNLLISASRKIATIRGDPAHVRLVVTQVFGAKLVLSLACAAVCLALFPLIAMARHNMSVFIMALVLGIAQGHSTYWFFGGTGNLRFVATTDVLGRLLGVAGIFAFVHAPQDVWIVFLAQACGILIATSVAIAIMISEFTGRFLPDLMGGVKLLRENVHLFTQNFVGVIYTGSTALIMGLVAHPQLVGYFSAAERVVRAAVLPAMPLRQTFFPTISARVHEDLPGAVKLVRKILLYAGSLAAVLSLVLFAFAEPLVRLAVGDQFGDSVPVLRIMAVLPLIFLIQEVLSVLWLLPMRCDRYCSVVVATAGTVHLVGVFAFSALWGAQGTALAMVLSNLTALCLFVLKTARLKAHPLVTIGSRVD